MTTRSQRTTGTTYMIHILRPFTPRLTPASSPLSPSPPHTHLSYHARCRLPYTLGRTIHTPPPLPHKVTAAVPSLHEPSWTTTPDVTRAAGAGDVAPLGIVVQERWSRLERASSPRPRLPVASRSVRPPAGVVGRVGASPDLVAEGNYWRPWSRERPRLPERDAGDRHARAGSEGPTPSRA